MKKSIFFALVGMVILTLQSFTNPTPKSGILQKDHYSAFTGNQWEEFLYGSNEAVFNAKANTTLSDYRKMVEEYVQSKFGMSTSEMLDNSKVYDFPDGATVKTARLDGSWVTRSKYPGERGYYHVPTSTFWLSFECGNLCDFKAQVGSSRPSVTPPAEEVGANPSVKTIVIEKRVEVPVEVKKEVTWKEGLLIGTEFMDAVNMQSVKNAYTAKLAADLNSCCGQSQGGGSGGGATNVTYLVTSNTQPQPQGQVQSERYPTFGGAVLRQGLGTAAGIGLAYLGAQLLGPRGGFVQQPLPNAGWGNNWGNNFVPQNPQPGFSGSSTPLGGSTQWTGNNNTWNGGTTAGGWSNTWQ